MSYEPRLYGLVTPEALAGDRDWYRHRARETGGPVLELGAGTGRITLGLAQDGIAIHALEADPAMLDALRRKAADHSEDVQGRVTVVEADMQRFQLPERSALIIAPFRAFLHNLTDRDQMACLTRVREHLRPGGRFAFNVFHPSLEYMSHHSGALAGVWRWVGTVPLPDGGCVVRSEANRYAWTTRHAGYAISQQTEADRAVGKPWVLYVNCPAAAVNFDTFVYLPRHNYPERDLAAPSRGRPVGLPAGVGRPAQVMCQRANSFWNELYAAACSRTSNGLKCMSASYAL
jgi:ubiquinone/menaquinone biosynthesis C-methylase UbiE